MVVGPRERPLLRAVLLKAISSSPAPASPSSLVQLLARGPGLQPPLTLASEPKALAPRPQGLECEWQEWLLAGLPEPASALRSGARLKRKSAELPE